MRTALAILCSALIIALVGFCVYIICSTSDAAEDGILTQDFVRLHVRADDDTEEQQALKLKVRDGILSFTTSLLAGVSDGAEAKSLLEDNLALLCDVAEHTLAENGSDKSVTVRLDREYFEYREYDGFYLPAGDYDALIVEIGSGQGHNWWCVIFPAVCYSGAAGEIKTDTSSVPVKYRIADRQTVGDVQIEWWIVKVFKRLFA